MAEHAIEGRDDKPEKAMFAVFQVAVVLKKLKADYYAAWHGERRSTWASSPRCTVLADLFDSDDFPVPIPDPEAAAEIVIQWLIDVGFEIKAQERAQPWSAPVPIQA
jgi:hypothetical protein